MSKSIAIAKYYQGIVQKILIDARSIDQTGDTQVDSYVDSIIRTCTSVLEGSESCREG